MRPTPVNASLAQPHSPLILFGAGASYGSDTSDTPPLGASLFAALQQFNPDAWGAIKGAAGEVFRSDFEEGMRQLGEANSHALPPLQRANRH